MTSLVSCSLVETTRQSLLGDSSPRKKVKKEIKWVSKAQYDDLMIKYKTVSSKYEKLKEDRMTNKSAFNQLNELASSNTAEETVDVFGEQGLIKSAPIARKKSPKVSINIDKVEEELNYFKKAVALYDNGKVEESLKMFQILERSSHKQIKVRSKKYIGDTYFSKKQYDLALQVYENIINNDAYSGKVIPALRSAAICSGKLGLNEKKIQYESILKDFFEVQI
jgi:lipopolysaccharide biosynthesis regulator YciM